MTVSTSRYRIDRAGRWGLAMGTVLLVGCSAMISSSEQATSSFDRSESSPAAAEVLGSDAGTTAADIPQKVSQPIPEPPPGSVASQPQLVKQAHLNLVLNDLETATETVRHIVDQAQGSLLGLQDRRSPAGVAREISLTLTVPQDQLDQVLAEIRKLGALQQQTITVEDVSDQLVDLEARLKNLEKSEEALLEIMERSGDIADVLEVSRELSTVRETIERLAAQQQSLKRKVVYSYIYLTLNSPTTAITPLRPAGETLHQTWQTATRSVQAFTLAGLKLGLWLLAYSPYIIVLLAILAFGHYRLRQTQFMTSATRDDGQG